MNDYGLYAANIPYLQVAVKSGTTLQAVSITFMGILLATFNDKELREVNIKFLLQ